MNNLQVFLAQSNAMQDYYEMTREPDPGDYSGYLRSNSKNEEPWHPLVWLIIFLAVVSVIGSGILQAIFYNIVELIKILIGHRTTEGDSQSETPSLTSILLFLAIVGLVCFGFFTAIQDKN